MDTKEAEVLVREDKCEGCKGTVFGYDCSMEDDCEDFQKEVKQTLKDEKEYEESLITGDKYGY